MNVGCADCFERVGWDELRGREIGTVVIIDGRSLCLDHAEARYAGSRADMLFGYERGQTDPATPTQRRLAEEFLAGRLSNVTRPIPVAAIDVAREIVNRINRGRQP